MKKSTTPVSRAKTVYGLLNEVAALTLDEPRRMRMATWITPIELLEPKSRPACGTAGCIGGWMEHLTGVNPESAYKLFSTDAGFDFFFGNDLIVAHEQGTPSHARAVVAHIRKFQKAHGTELRRLRVRRKKPRKAV